MVTTRGQQRAQEAHITAFPDPRISAASSTISVPQTRSLGVERKQSARRTQTAAQFVDIDGADEPPKYTIDLSLPPQERYVALALEYKPQLLNLTSLFDEVVEPTGLNVETVRSVARWLLRGVHSKEQTEELRGIAKAIGMEMYLLVAFNTLLDLFMGCTSGGVRVRDGNDNSTARMLHFRTLDWGMDGLREIIVTLEFVERAGGPVIARSVTYVGFVGVLTGVRKSLSVSLNFRPTHDSSSRWRELRFRGHQLLMLLGYKPSISSILRSMIIPSSHRTLFTRKQDLKPALYDLDGLIKFFPSVSSTAAYVIASDGTQTVVFEKDRNSATHRSSPTAIVVTNHDHAMEPAIAEHAAKQSQPHHDHAAPVTIEPKLGGEGQMPDLLDLLAESLDRSSCLEKKFLEASTGSSGKVCVRPQDVVRWIQEYPTTNEVTHFACVMDPKRGDMLWVRRWLETVSSGGDVSSDGEDSLDGSDGSDWDGEQEEGVDGNGRRASIMRVPTG